MAHFEYGFTKALVLGATLLLSACKTIPADPEPDWDSRSRAEIEDRISKSAERSTNALETLAMIERAKTEPVESGISEGLRDLPRELRRPTTVEWSGPAEDLAERLAENIGYEFMVQGDPPHVPMMIHLSEEDTPVIKVFENIGRHIAPRGTLIVDPNVSRIEFTYEIDDDPVNSSSANNE